MRFSCDESVKQLQAFKKPIVEVLQEWQFYQNWTKKNLGGKIVLTYYVMFGLVQQTKYIQLASEFLFFP